MRNVVLLFGLNQTTWLNKDFQNNYPFLFFIDDL